MKIFEFLDICPPDHELIIYFSKARKQVHLLNKKHIFNNPHITYKDMYEDMGFVNADDTKIFYITTKI